MSASRQYVGGNVSRRKFDRQIDEFRSLESEYRRRGWFLLTADYPRAVVMLVVPQIRPPAVLAAVAFDYTNYDADPPSVSLVDPFTFDPYLAKNLPTRLDRDVGQGMSLPIPIGLPPGARLQQLQPYMQWHSPDEVPFLCLPGVREYHSHPAHSGDAWALHRKSGAGRMVRVLEVIQRYGVDPIKDYGVQVQIVPHIAGFQAEAPA